MQSYLIQNTENKIYNKVEKFSNISSFENINCVIDYNRIQIHIKWEVVNSNLFRFLKSNAGGLGQIFFFWGGV